MSDLFSAEWMQKFADQWNNEPELSDALGEIGFNSTIGYGFKGDDAPAGVIVVENGKVTSAGAFEGQELNWDLRADVDSWNKWIAKGIGMMGLGTAYTTGKLKFSTGDYKAMAKDPRMAGPFIKSFNVMGRV
ncbi:MAG: SCP-2 sterol transfer family protein [Gammaproteobacteria bacterium]